MCEDLILLLAFLAGGLFLLAVGGFFADRHAARSCRQEEEEELEAQLNARRVCRVMPYDAAPEDKHGCA